MILPKFSLTLGITLTIISCMSPEKLLNNTSAERLYFGKSGGFTNSSMDYVVINFQHVYKVEGGEYRHILKLDKSQSQKIKSLSDDIRNLQLNKPGNMTYYIRISSGETEKEIKWSDQTKNDKVKELYKTLISTLNP